MAEADGPLPKTGTEIKMSRQGDLIELGTAESHGHENLWTDKMGACCAVATYETKTGKRTLCHLQGGEPTEDYFKAAAEEINEKEETSIIVVAGTEGSFGWFKDTVNPLVKDGITKAMKKAGKKTDKLEFHLPFWTDPADDKKAGADTASFVIEGDGSYQRGKISK